MKNQLLHSFPLWASLVLAAPFNGNGAPLDEGALVIRSDDQPAQEAIVLKPATHWAVNTDSSKNIVPSNAQRLYYSQDGTAQKDVAHQFGSLKTTFSLPAVNVDNSDHITINKAGGDVTINFNGDAAYDNAYASWGSLKKLLLLTYDNICYNHANGDYCYVVIDSPTWDNATNTATARGKAVDSEDYITAVDFEWGNYKPESKRIIKRDAMNGTVTSNTTSSEKCGSSHSGLRTTVLGENFDERLDDCIGYESMDATAWKSYAKGLGADQEPKYRIHADDSKDLHGVASLLHPKEAKARANALAAKNHEGNHEGNSTSAMVKRDLIKRGWLSWLPFKIPFINKPVSADFRKQFGYSLPSNRNPDRSPWGPAKLLYKKTGQKTSSGKNGRGSGDVSADGSIHIYCVDCGADGSVTLYGKGSWALDSGLTEGYVQANANLKIAFKLGLDVQGVLTARADQQIASFGLPGLSFGVITIGPLVTLGADFAFIAQAEGKLLAGATFGIQNAVTRLDFVHRQNSYSAGWTPVFEPIFEASGQVAVGAEIGIPLAISVGINILNGKYVKSVGVVERPSIEAKAQFAATADTAGARITKTDGCAGIATQVDFKNELYADIIGYKFNLMSPFTKTLTKGCIRIPSTSGKYAGATTPASFSATNDNFMGYNTTGGIEYREIVDSTGGYFTATCPDGNLYLQQKLPNVVNGIQDKHCSKVFETIHHSVIGDGNSRLIHYYSDAMAKHGVSRLRVHNDATLPKTAEFVSFFAFSNKTGHLAADKNEDADTPATKAYYLARNMKQQLLYPAVCTYEHDVPKLFLIKDPVTGLHTLQDPHLQTSVTGGVVSSCMLFPGQHALNEKGSDFNNRPNVNQGAQGMTDGERLDNWEDL